MSVSRTTFLRLENRPQLRFHSRAVPDARAPPVLPREAALKLMLGCCFGSADLVVGAASADDAEKQTSNAGHVFEDAAGGGAASPRPGRNKSGPTVIDSSGTLCPEEIQGSYQTQ